CRGLITTLLAKATTSQVKQDPRAVIEEHRRMIGRSVTSTIRRPRRSVVASNVDREISSAQFLALYEHMPMVLVVNVVNAALVALVLASYMDQTRWWIFFGLVVTLTGARTIGWSYYRHHRQAVEDKTKWTLFA